jgi:hypothetical protein
MLFRLSIRLPVWNKRKGNHAPVAPLARPVHSGGGVSHEGENGGGHDDRREMDGRGMSFFPTVSRQINAVFIHCSDSDHAHHDDISVIRRWHLERTPPFSDVGYHFFIKKDGTIQNGRPIDKSPAAQAGFNRGTIAICLHGKEKDKFTTAQFSSLRGLCSAINASLGGRVVFRGHCEVSAKTCPVFDYAKVLGLSGNGRMKLDDSPQTLEA